MLYDRDLKKAEEHIANQVKTDPKALFKYANSKRTTRAKIGPLKFTTSSGNVTYKSGPKEMADILGNQYNKVFSEPLQPHELPSSNPSHQIKLEDIEINGDDIIKAISSISNSSAPGPDGVTPKLLKTYSAELIEPLHALFRRSLDTGEPFDGINLAHITPIFKSGEKSDPANYRPIALTNHITKIFEKLLKSALVNHLSSQHLYNESQHGFRSSRSTLTNLIEYYESILLQLETSTSVDSIYLDFSKAFDKCDHNIILRKLQQLRVEGKILNWINNFLKLRQQCVCVDGSKSEKVWVKSGVPQGSVLGPVLFLILMYDITKGITHAILSSFADDTKVWRGISSTNDQALLQHDLNLIYNWAQANNMLFNNKKFQAIRFADLLNPANYIGPDGKQIQDHITVKDLGIHMSCDLSFEFHIRELAAKGKRLAGWILRTFQSRHKEIMLILLKLIIHPTLEYCCVLWSPTDSTMISLLESVQRFFVRKINFDSNADMDYWDRLNSLKLYSLQRRRERYLIIYTWKVLNGLYPNPGILLNSTLQPQHSVYPNTGIDIARYNDRTGALLKHDQGNTSHINKLSILSKCCNLYNILPSKLRILNAEPPSLNVFKRNLDTWLLTIPDQPTIASRHRPAASNSLIHQKDYAT